MPSSEGYLLPELAFREESSLLTHSVDLRVSDCVGLVHISLKHKGKEALPASENCIVEGGQPVKKKQLPRKACKEWELDLCEDEDNVLVEVRTYEFWDSDIAISTMNEEES